MAVVQSDELDAFDAFARGRMRELLRFAHVLTGDPHRAADLVQDALERTLMSWDRVVRKDDPEAYVRRAIVNRSVSVWRRTRRERLVAESPDQPYVDRPGHDDELWAALATLPPRQRAVLVLRYYEDLSEADTAAALGCSVGTVKSQTFKGLARLRTIVGSYGSDVGKLGTLTTDRNGTGTDTVGTDAAATDTARGRDSHSEGTRSWTS